MIITEENIVTMKAMQICFLPCVKIQENGKTIVETAIQYELYKNGDYIVKYFNPLAKEYDQVCNLDHVIDKECVKGTELLNQFKNATAKKDVLDKAVKADKINKTN